MYRKIVAIVTMIMLFVPLLAMYLLINTVQAIPEVILLNKRIWDDIFKKGEE